MSEIKVVRPDILDCLANLSSDEVFTPPAVVNKMLDLLPQKLFRSPKTRFLDPFTKSGVFLREIVKRLDKGLEDIIPDKEERIRHIFANQVYGIAITQLTALFSRRSLYCNKDVNNVRSTIRNCFRTEDGNIGYHPCRHTWVDGSCKICGASKKALSQSPDVENYAYPFLHDEVFMKQAQELGFDVVIGNPPYQMKDGGSGTGISAVPIYHQFVKQAKRLNARYLTMIIPSRWFAGGKGLDEFRSEMLGDDSIRKIVDFPDSTDCFEGVSIAGGVNYFLRDSKYHGDCEITTNRNGVLTTSVRSLSEYDIFVRSNESIAIMRRILASGDETMEHVVSSRNPFGFDSKQRGEERSFRSAIRLVSSAGVGYVKRSDVIRNRDLIDKWKVSIGKVVPCNGEVGVDPSKGYKAITKTRIHAPGEVFTESYLLLASFDSKMEAENFSSYMMLRFPRFLLHETYSSMNITKSNFRFVPFLDYSRAWTDDELYSRYSLNKREREFVSGLIRPMDAEEKR